jgi:hypothetical protein
VFIGSDELMCTYWVITNISAGNNNIKKEKEKETLLFACFLYKRNKT